jgi:hypothetical protein
MGPGGPVVQPPNEDEVDAEEKDEEDPADQEQAQDQTGNGAPTGQDGSPPNQGPKTPEQILEMIRQHRQTPPGSGQQIPQPNSQPPDNE